MNLYTPRKNERLCQSAFVAAEAARSAKYWRPNWLEGAVTHKELSIEIDGEGSFCTRYAFGAGMEFVNWRCELVDNIESFFGYDTFSAWSRNRVALESMWCDFFGHASVASQPALVFLMPIYVSKSRLREPKFASPARVHSVDRIYLTSRGSRIQLGFGSGYNVPAVRLPTSNMCFMHPDTRRNTASPPLAWMQRERLAVRPAGHAVPTALEQIAGLAWPDEQHWLEKGYYPAHVDLVDFGNKETSRYIKCHVVVLARLMPMFAPFSSEVHQLVIALDAASAQIINCNTVMRMFNAFSDYYPTLPELIERSV